MECAKTNERHNVIIDSNESGKPIYIMTFRAWWDDLRGFLNHPRFDYDQLFKVAFRKWYKKAASHDLYMYTCIPSSLSNILLYYIYAYIYIYIYIVTRLFCMIYRCVYRCVYRCISNYDSSCMMQVWLSVPTT